MHGPQVAERGAKARSPSLLLSHALDPFPLSLERP